MYKTTAQAEQLGSPAKSVPPRCQVPGCNREVTCRPFFKRCRVCQHHSKAPWVEMNGIKMRFCYLCKRFHELHLFQGDRKSCSRMMDNHNRRRREHRMAGRKREGTHGGTDQDRRPFQQDPLKRHSSLVSNTSTPLPLAISSTATLPYAGQTRPVPTQPWGGSEAAVIKGEGQSSGASQHDSAQHGKHGMEGVWQGQGLVIHPSSTAVPRTAELAAGGQPGAAAAGGAPGVCGCGLALHCRQTAHLAVTSGLSPVTSALLSRTNGLQAVLIDPNAVVIVPPAVASSPLAHAASPSAALPPELASASLRGFPACSATAAPEGFRIGNIGHCIGAKPALGWQQGSRADAVRPGAEGSVHVGSKVKHLITEAELEDLTSWIPQWVEDLDFDIDGADELNQDQSGELAPPPLLWGTAGDATPHTLGSDAPIVPSSLESLPRPGYHVKGTPRLEGDVEQLCAVADRAQPLSDPRQSAHSRKSPGAHPHLAHPLKICTDTTHPLSTHPLTTRPHISMASAAESTWDSGFSHRLYCLPAPAARGGAINPTRAADDLPSRPCRLYPLATSPSSLGAAKNVTAPSMVDTMELTGQGRPSPMSSSQLPTPGVEIPLPAAPTCCLARCWPSSYTLLTPTHPGISNSPYCTGASAYLSDPGSPFSPLYNAVRHCFRTEDLGGRGSEAEVGRERHHAVDLSSAANASSHGPDEG